MTHEVSMTFVMGLSTYFQLKVNEEQESERENNKARREVIKECYKELIERDERIEAYALFRIATEVFLSDYTTLITGGYITRLSDFS